MSEMILGVGPAHELELTLRNADWEIGDVTKMTQDAELCRQIRAVLRGLAKIETIIHQCWRTVDANTIQVNNDAPPKLPFDGATVEWPKPSDKGRGWVQIQRRDGKLYQDGCEVVLHLEEGQKTGYVHGRDLRKALEINNVLHPNILDALFENPHLIPESWKQDEQGRIRYIYFWAAGFRSGAYLYVRYFCWRGGAWYRYCYHLDHRLDAQNPAAILAS